MALVERGRTGVTITLAPDSVTGVVTQDPESMLHSIAGIEDADGNTAYGIPFELMCRIAQTASGTTTVSHFASDVPYKFRVLGGDVECLQDAHRRTENGTGRASVNVMAGSTNTIASVNVTGMRQGDVKRVQINTLGNEEVAADGSLSVAAVSVLPEIATTTTWELLVKLHCLRVI